MHTATILDQFWPQAWQQRRFRMSLFGSLLLLGGIAFFIPHFFAYIQARPGIPVADWLLDELPARDVSAVTFGIIYSGILAAIIWLIPRPYLLLTALWAYAFLQLARLLTLTLVPLAPPPALILLHDPVVDRLFYASPTPITHDLFFSGHTGTLFLLGLCVPAGWRRWSLLLGSAVVGLLVLVQHTHYTYDVVAAPFFAAFCFWLARRTSKAWLDQRQTL